MGAVAAMHPVAVADSKGGGKREDGGSKQYFFTFLLSLFWAVFFPSLYRALQ
jgi:hypothetical protein